MVTPDPRLLLRLVPHTRFGKVGRSPINLNIGIVYLHSQTVFDIDQVPDESDAIDDDEPGPIIGNAPKVGTLEDSRVGEVDGKEEAIGAEEAGGGGLVVARGEVGKVWVL
ncbi:hypothetical protein TorRG33x02_337410 [Trema orientale]|uniref:Uncharacterized protein n=1 Tax=Trema orientale TaxID=63057 RepID=A0A2P5AZ45_TREOI|nr:hypothetical protein TorRG33x02_337410 [Trema orientale]